MVLQLIFICICVGVCQAQGSSTNITQSANCDDIFTPVDDVYKLDDWQKNPRAFGNTVLGYFSSNLDERTTLQRLMDMAKVQASDPNAIELEFTPQLLRGYFSQLPDLIQSPDGYSTLNNTEQQLAALVIDNHFNHMVRNEPYYYELSSREKSKWLMDRFSIWDVIKVELREKLAAEPEFCEETCASEKVTGSLITRCPTEITQLTSPDTGISTIQLTISGTKLRLNLPAGTYSFETEQDGVSCNVPVTIIDNNSMQRLAFRMHYHIDCSILSNPMDSFSLHHQADEGFNQLESKLCQNDCTRGIGQDSDLRCTDSILSVIWPTNLTYAAGVSQVPDDLMLRLTDRLTHIQTLPHMYIYSNKPPRLVYPTSGKDGRFAEIILIRQGE